MNQHTPSYDPDVLRAKRLEREAALVAAVKQAFGFGSCKVVNVNGIGTAMEAVRQYQQKEKGR